MKTAPLDSVAEVIRGITFSKADSSTVPEDGRRPVIRAGSIQQTLLLDEGQIWVPSKKFKSHQLIKKNDIIMCTSSGSSNLVGKCAKSDQDWNGSFGAFCAGIRVDNSKCDSSYLYHFLCSPLFRNWTKSSSGANIKNIRTSELAKFKIPLPSLKEQKCIAAILDKADAIRRKRLQATQLADNLLRSVFLDMFSDPHVNPMNWPKVTLNDIVSINAPMVEPRDEEYLDMIHIGPDRIVKKSGEILPALTAREEGLISGKFLFNSQHVLYTKIRPYLRKVALPTFSGLCSADMYPVLPDTRIITREYLWSILISKALISYYENLPDRANIPKINRKELLAFKCMLPPIELQEKYSRLFRRINDNKNKIKLGQNMVGNLIATLSQRAFRGEN